MRFRSKKTERVYRQRRSLVAQLLDEYPVCQRCNAARSTDVHEIKSRARGGSILDPVNLACLCRQCHTFITENPRVALDEGWSRHSWDKFGTDWEGMT